MDIKKAKVLGNCEWSPSTQKKLASMLGVSAATVLASAALTACDTTSATSGDVIEPTSSEQMTCGEMPCDWEYNESSSSQTRLSSSSYEIDTLDVTSGEVVPPEFLEPESGSNIDTGHLESSSSVAPSSSSVAELVPLAGDPVVTEPVVEPGPMLSGVIEDTPVHVDEPKQ
jgi:DNA-binding transcriptional regulator YdaS (Cro superfamily)